MAPGRNNDALKVEELTALVREIRERVRLRYPSSAGGTAGTPLVDLAPLVHARDAAETKVAAIGSVNPRPPGLVNALIQTVKRAIARGLDWFIRDQTTFNRETMACVEATIEALNEVNHAFVALAGQIRALEQPIAELRSETEVLKDIRAHWTTWRPEWERKLASNEMQFLRGIADLQGAFQHRATVMEDNFRGMVKAQHADYLGALDRANLDIQKKLWTELEQMRNQMATEYEALIHSELRTVRQRAGYLAQAGGAAAVPVPGAPPAASAAPVPPPPVFDYGRFAERFRGPEAYVKESQRLYVPYFAECTDVLDIGCGRGEFLELMREAGVAARGIDLSEESAGICHGKGLAAETADLFTYLDGLDDGSLDGIFSAQVVEHLAPERIPEMIRLAAKKLRRGGVLAIETPNPECLAIFATHYYLDPTHTRPVPRPLLAFYMEEFGIGRLEMHYRSPALESAPALAGLPEDFREAFFDGLDYAIIGRKLVA